MRRAAVVTLLGAMAVRGGPTVGLPGFNEDLIRFNAAFNEFVRDYWGCPARATTTDECQPGAGTINYGAYQRAAHLAGKVFPR